MESGGGGHFDGTFAVFLDGSDGIDADSVRAEEKERAVDAAHHQGDAPVPAAVTVGLADQVEVRNLAASVHRDRERQFFRRFLAFLLHRLEGDGDRVGSGVEQRLDFGTVAAEHVVGRNRLASVDPDGGEGVEHFAVQKDGLFFQQGFRNFEVADEFPVAFSPLLNQRLVASVIRVRNLPRREKRAVIVARQLRRNRIALPLRAAQPPHSAEIDRRIHPLFSDSVFRIVLPYNIKPPSRYSRHFSRGSVKQKTKSCKKCNKVLKKEDGRSIVFT